MQVPKKEHVSKSRNIVNLPLAVNYQLLDEPLSRVLDASSFVPRIRRGVLINFLLTSWHDVISSNLCNPPTETLRNQHIKLFTFIIDREVPSAGKWKETTYEHMN